MDDRLGGVFLEGIQHPNGALDVGVHGVEGRIKAGVWKALSGEMEYVVRPRLGHRVADRQAVPEIAVDQRNPLLGIDAFDEVGKVVHRTTPAA